MANGPTGSGFARLANLGAILGAIFEYVKAGGGFRMRSRHTEDGELVMTMRVEEPDAFYPRVSRRLGRLLRRGRMQGR